MRIQIFGNEIDLIMSTKSENYFRTSVYNSALGGRECLSRIKWQLGRTVNQNIIETVWNIQIDKWDKSEKKKKLHYNEWL